MPNWLDSARRTQSRRRQARNFSNVEAQKRLNETVAPFHQQVENALYVDGSEVIVFKQSKVGRPCTCKKVPASEDMDNAGDLPTETQKIMPQSSQNDGVRFEMTDDDVFGEYSQEEVAQHGPNAPKSEQMRVFEAADLISEGTGGRDSFDNDDNLITGFEDGLFSGTSVNCGICYRTGVQPPYEPLNHTMYTLTNYDIHESSGYFLDTSEFPARLLAEAQSEAWARFEINVPKYFKNVKFSVRDNLSILKYDKLYVSPTANEPLTRQFLEQNRGRPISIYVRAVDFTHTVIFFENDSSPLLVNLSQENESLDYTRESTVGQITVIGPERIGHIQNADIICVPKRNLTLKVTEAPRPTTAEKVIIQWELSTRAVQSSESIRNIFKGYKVY